MVAVAFAALVPVLATVCVDVCGTVVVAVGFAAVVLFLGAA